MAGVPAQLAALQVQLAPFLGLPGQLATMQQELWGLPGQLAAMQQELAAMRQQQQQQHSNSLLRLVNNHATRGVDSLVVLHKEQAGGLQPLGAQPAVQPAGDYPATSSQLGALMHAQLDALANFYHEDFGRGPAAAQAGPITRIEQRRHLFALWVGAPH